VVRLTEKSKGAAGIIYVIVILIILLFALSWSFNGKIRIFMFVCLGIMFLLGLFVLYKTTRGDLNGRNKNTRRIG